MVLKIYICFWFLILLEFSHFYTCMYHRVLFIQDFTLEFSRDRKSMSVYCKDKRNKSDAKMFVKVCSFLMSNSL